jgi:hypothetical protein
MPPILALATRILPAVTAAGGRAAAAGAVRLGASEGVSAKIGAYAENKIGEGATKLMNNSLSAMGGHGGGNNESRVQNFSAGGGDSAPSGGQFDTYNPVS